jgi:hypothetical protein
MHAKLRPIIFLSNRKEGAQMALSSFSYVSADGVKIAAYRWDTAGEPRAAVQLTHGMASADGHAFGPGHGHCEDRSGGVHQLRSSVT